MVLIGWIRMKVDIFHILWKLFLKRFLQSVFFELCGGVHDIHSLRFTSGVTHLPVYNASIAASRFPHMCVSAEVGCQDLNCRPPARQSDVLPTRPRRPAFLQSVFYSYINFWRTNMKSILTVICICSLWKYSKRNTITNQNGTWKVYHNQSSGQYQWLFIGKCG